MRKSKTLNQKLSLIMLGPARVFAKSGYYFVLSEIVLKFRLLVVIVSEIFYYLCIISLNIETNCGLTVRCEVPIP